MWLELLRYKLSLVIVLAIVARLGALLALPGVFAYTEPGVAIQGSAAYDEYAVNLLETGVYGREAGVADAGLPPLYSYVLSQIYRAFSRHYLAVAAVHIVFDALSIALLYDICRRLFPRRSDWIGAVAGSASPSTPI